MRLIILGEGPLQAKLEALCKSLNIVEDVRFGGFVENPLALIRKASLFAMASRWEGFCNVIVEALYCGVPVVATDCPSGPAEILESGRFGRLVATGDADAFAEQMDAALGAPADPAPLRKRAQDFTAERIADEYEGLFIELMERDR